MFVWCYLVGSNILLRLCNTQHCYCLLLLNSKHKRKQGKEINTMFLLILFKDIKFVFISLQKAAAFFCVKSYLFRFFLNINRVLWTEKKPLTPDSTTTDDPCGRYMWIATRCWEHGTHMCEKQIETWISRSGWNVKITAVFLFLYIYRVLVLWKKRRKHLW